MQHLEAVPLISMSTCEERIFDGCHLSSIDNRCSLSPSVFLLLAAVPLLWHPLPQAGSHCGAERARGPSSVTQAMLSKGAIIKPTGIITFTRICQFMSFQNLIVLNSINIPKSSSLSSSMEPRSSSLKSYTVIIIIAPGGFRFLSECLPIHIFSSHFRTFKNVLSSCISFIQWFRNLPLFHTSTVIIIIITINVVALQILVVSGFHQNLFY